MTRSQFWDAYFKIIDAVEAREPELLDFAKWAPGDADSLLHDNLFDQRNKVQGRGFA